MTVGKQHSSTPANTSCVNVFEEERIGGCSYITLLSEIAREEPGVHKKVVVTVLPAFWVCSPRLLLIYINELRSNALDTDYIIVNSENYYDCLKANLLLYPPMFGSTEIRIYAALTYVPYNIHILSTHGLATLVVSMVTCECLHKKGKVETIGKG